MDNCGCGDFPIIPPGGPGTDPQNSIDVVGVGEIHVSHDFEQGKKVYSVSRVPYQPPVINATTNPTFEVGFNVGSFTWNVTINPGSQTITSRVISPTPSPAVDLNAPFTLTITNRKVTVRGTTILYTITIQDGATVVTKQITINFWNKVYMGFSPNDTLLLSEVSGLTGNVVSDIKAQYGGQHNYNVPPSVQQQYIYWLFESGTAPFGLLQLNGLPFPFTTLSGTLNIPNSNDGSIVTPYIVVRSVNKFSQTTLAIAMS